ncbi:hypothetical protein NQ315_003393, partial [Exocentrus adspersus]
TGEEEPSPLPCLVYVHGESYEWNSGNPYDGTVLASAGRVIVVTINFRLGVLGSATVVKVRHPCHEIFDSAPLGPRSDKKRQLLFYGGLVTGFLKTGTKGSAQGNFGLMDLVAGLHWLRENLPAFGGDPERVTLMGHSTGAALVNFIAVSPVAKELLHRVILLSGSGLSPWALQRDPLRIKRSVAEHTGCHGDLHEDDLAPCLRLKPLNQLLGVKVDTPRFLPGFAPFIDGTILLNPTNPPPTSSSSTVATSAGYELADFPERDLLFGLTSTESYLDLNAQDLEFGFNETKRDRILRTYVRNSYYYHLNEIFSTLKNEYTDWERPTQNPLSVRDATLDVLSDGHTAAPLIRIGYLHTMSGGKTFFLHFQHHSGDRDFPMRPGSVRGEDLPFVLGLPLIGGGPFFPHNYSHSDATISKTLIHYISNFVRKGDPNGAVPNASASEAKNSQKDHDETSTPYWDTYDTINQFYLELGNRPERKDHYRGHKMSLWLNLIPQLHRPGEGDDISMRHHHFQEEDDQYYDGNEKGKYVLNITQFYRMGIKELILREAGESVDLNILDFTGSVRSQKETPPLIHLIVPPPPMSTARIPPASTSPTPPPPKSDTALQATTTECPPNSTILMPSQNKNSNNNLLRKLASSHYQSYTTALTVTIAVGCFLLLLNILIFAGSCSSSSGDAYDKAYESRQMAGSFDCNATYQATFERKMMPNYMGEFSCDKRLLAEVQMTELPLQEFNSSPPPAKRPEGNPHSHPPDVTTSTLQDVQNESLVSPSIPEPPPPPKGQPPPGANQTGILRAQGAPTTPGTMKKRVQIQEISV